MQPFLLHSLMCGCIWIITNMISNKHITLRTTCNTKHSSFCLSSSSAQFWLQRRCCTMLLLIFVVPCALLAVILAFFCFSFSALIDWWRWFGQKLCNQATHGLLDGTLPVLILFESCSLVFDTRIEKQKTNSLTLKWFIPSKHTFHKSLILFVLLRMRMCFSFRVSSTIFTQTLPYGWMWSFHSFVSDWLYNRSLT